MVAGSWTVEDGRTWWELRARDRVTAYLVVLWVLSRVGIAVLPPVSLCDRTTTCIPSPGAAWWWVLLWTSILLIRLWPLAAVLCGFTFAFADMWWVRASAWHAMWRPIVELVYALGCAAHLLYLDRARNRQHRFALEHAATTVPPPATGNFYRWRPFPVVGSAILGVILLTILGLPFIFSVSQWDPKKMQNADTWPAIAGCGFVLGGLVAWRQQQRRQRSVRGGGPAIPVEVSLGPAGVYVYARQEDEAFTRFASNVTNAFRADVLAGGNIFTGYLYGDLRIGGFAAFTGDDVSFVPSSGLKGPIAAALMPTRDGEAHASQVTAAAPSTDGEPLNHTRVLDGDKPIDASESDPGDGFDRRVPERVMSITVMDPGRPQYRRLVRASMMAAGFMGVILSFSLLTGGNKYTLTATGPVPGAGMWVVIAMGVSVLAGWLIGITVFRPYRYTLEDDCLTRERSTSQMTSVERITKVEWSTGVLTGVRITSSSFTCTLTVREQTRPLLSALGESLTRLNLLDKLQSAST